jgi:hypothetical protein
MATHIYLLRWGVSELLNIWPLESGDHTTKYHTRGPYLVLSYGEKCFCLAVRGRVKMVYINRLRALLRLLNLSIKVDIKTPVHPQCSQQILAPSLLSGQQWSREAVDSLYQDQPPFLQSRGCGEACGELCGGSLIVQYLILQCV